VSAHSFASHREEGPGNQDKKGRTVGQSKRYPGKMWGGKEISVERLTTRPGNSTVCSAGESKDVDNSGIMSEEDPGGRVDRT